MIIIENIIVFLMMSALALAIIFWISGGLFLAWVYFHDPKARKVNPIIWWIWIVPTDVDELMEYAGDIIEQYINKKES